MVLCQNLCEKRQIWISEPHFGEVTNDIRPWLIARWKAHGRRSICLNCTFFAIYYSSAVMRWNMYSSAVFAWGRLLCIQIWPGEGHLHQPFLA